MQKKSADGGFKEPDNWDDDMMNRIPWFATKGIKKYQDNKLNNKVLTHRYISYHKSLRIIFFARWR